MRRGEKRMRIFLFENNVLQFVDRLLDSPIICRLDEMVSSSS